MELVTNNITQIINRLIGFVCVSIYSQAAAGQSNPGYKVTYIYYHILNYTNRKNCNLQATDDTHKSSGYHIYHIH